MKRSFTILPRLFSFMFTCWTNFSCTCDYSKQQNSDSCREMNNDDGRKDKRITHDEGERKKDPWEGYLMGKQVKKSKTVKRLETTVFSLWCNSRRDFAAVKQTETKLQKETLIRFQVASNKNICTANGREGKQRETMSALVKYFLTWSALVSDQRHCNAQSSSAIYFQESEILQRDSHRVTRIYAGWCQEVKLADHSELFLNFYF